MKVAASQGELGKGSFQELDQLKVVAPFCKAALRATCVAEIAPAISSAVAAAVGGRPGAAYVDLPSDVLFAEALSRELPPVPNHGRPMPWPGISRPQADPAKVGTAAALIKNASRCAHMVIMLLSYVFSAILHICLLELQGLLVNWSCDVALIPKGLWVSRN